MDAPYGLTRMRAHVGREPFGPMMKLFGVTIAAVEVGGATLHAAPADDFDNQLGVMHGGYAATLLDSACGAAMYTLLGEAEYCMTLELKVNYLRAIRTVDGPLEILGRVRKKGGAVGFTEAEIRDASGEVYATGSATMTIRR